MKFLCLFLMFFQLLSAKVQLGVDHFFQEEGVKQLKGKNVALITNHTSLDSRQRSTLELFQQEGCKIVALFSPEHGAVGAERAEEKFADRKEGKIHRYSL